jgi:hypothetical protein
VFAARQTATSPEVVVGRFCRLDFEGVSLASANPLSHEFAELVSGDEEWPSEPIEIVRAFHVGSSKIHKETAAVTVRYDLLGNLSGALESDKLVVADGTETVAFPLIREGGRWKVKVFNLPPHVSVGALRKHIQGVMEDDEKRGDSHRTAILEALIAKLDALSK